MGKMTGVILMAFAIELALALFWQTPTTHTSLYTYLTNPSDTGSNPLYNLIYDNIGKIATLSAIIVGFFFILRVEVAYAGVAIVFFAFVAQIAQLWNIIRSQAWFPDPQSAAIVATICVAPLLVFYMITCLDYIRRPD